MIAPATARLVAKATVVALATGAPWPGCSSLKKWPGSSAPRSRRCGGGLKRASCPSSAMAGQSGSTQMTLSAISPPGVCCELRNVIPAAGTACHLRGRRGRHPKGRRTFPNLLDAQSTAACRLHHRGLALRASLASWMAGAGWSKADAFAPCGQTVGCPAVHHVRPGLVAVNEPSTGLAKHQFQTPFKGQCCSDQFPHDTGANDHSCPRKSIDLSWLGVSRETVPQDLSGR